FIRIWERREGSDLAERALFEMAQMQYRLGYMRRAVDAYDMFLINYPKSQWAQHAMKKLVQAALATFKGPRYDPTGLLEARRRLLDFQQRFPAAARQMDAVAILNRVDESLAARSLSVGRWYERNRKWISAREVYLRILKDPKLSKTASAREATQRLKALGFAADGPTPKKSSKADPEAGENKNKNTQKQEKKP
ncbi:MAG: outer membrane protein assembly factor BamD, partial [Phycisphaeraceae bacterium]|nr:outer membrane protein assembly factor BamD [Phycisphaeraceae bacterium]